MSDHLVLAIGLPLSFIALIVVAAVGGELQRRWNLRKRERMK